MSEHTEYNHILCRHHTLLCACSQIFEVDGVLCRVLMQIEFVHAQQQLFLNSMQYRCQVVLQGTVCELACSS